MDDRGIADEAEMMASIMGDEDFQHTVDDSGALHTFTFKLGPRVEETDAARVRLTLRMQLPAGYPDTEPPVATVLTSRGLSDADVKSVLSTAATVADENIGFNSCYTVMDAVVELLTTLNDSAAVCSVCLTAIQSHQPSYTAACMHSFHYRCLAPWVKCADEQLQAQLAADVDVAPLGKALAAARGKVQDKQNLHQHAAAALEALKAKVKETQSDLAGLEEALAATPSPSEEETAGLEEERRSAEALATALTAKISGATTKVTDAAAAVRQQEAALADAQDRWQQYAAKHTPKTPCPDCRQIIPFDDVKDMYVAWKAAKAKRSGAGSGTGTGTGTGTGCGSSTPVASSPAAGAGGSSPAGDADGAPCPLPPAAVEKSRKLMSELDAATRAYLNRFKKQWERVQRKQRSCGGMIAVTDGAGGS